MMQQMLLGHGPSGVDVEDVFSVDLYSGNATSRSINNGIDLNGEGGLVWIKRRNTTSDHHWFDTNRGRDLSLSSNRTYADVTGWYPGWFSSFDSTGFSLGSNNSYTNQVNINYAAYSIRKAPKFFDVITYTGNSATRNIPHNLGSQPGMVIIKARSSSTLGWYVWHKEQYASSTPGPNRMFSLNSTQSAQVYGVITGATDAHVSVINNATVNSSSHTYVMYVFAADTPNLIKTGIYSGNSTSQTINVGFQPQWVLIKNASQQTDWIMTDSTRGTNKQLFPNANYAEQQSGVYVTGFTSNGFSLSSNSSVNATYSQYAYMAIAAP